MERLRTALRWEPAPVITGRGEGQGQAQAGCSQAAQSDRFHA